jgi:hypothetical protein
LLAVPVETVSVSPISVRPVASTSFAAMPGGGTKKSAESEPSGVATVKLPEPTPDGTSASMLVADAAVTTGRQSFRLSELRTGSLAKFEQLIVKALPAAATGGEKPLITGGRQP